MKLCTLVYLLGSYVFKAPFDILHQNPPAGSVFQKTKKPFRRIYCLKFPPSFYLVSPRRYCCCYPK